LPKTSTQAFAAPPLCAARHLIASVTPAPSPSSTTGVAARLIWVIALFEQLERKEMARGEAAWARAPMR
jgi:hypothetical protein